MVVYLRNQRLKCVGNGKRKELKDFKEKEEK